MPKYLPLNSAGKPFPAGACPLCWKKADKRDRTNNGYHIECAKEAAAIIADMLHEKRGIAYEVMYSRRYPDRPVPNRPVPGAGEPKGK